MSKKKQIENLLKRAKKTGSTDESGDGDYASDLPNLKGERQIRTKMGDDGVEETHVTYVPIKDKTRMKPLGNKYNDIDWSK